MLSFIDYILSQKEVITALTLEHLRLTFIALSIAIIIGVPGGIAVYNFKKVRNFMLSSANAVQAIPSIALLGFCIPLFGIGSAPAIFAVTMYSVLPILKSTTTGISNINEQMIEVANGIGMTRAQRLRYVQVPIALPVIMSGLRIAAVTGVGLMTMAAFVGGGGLGVLVFSGIRTVNNYQILAGAIPACIMALGVDYIAGKLENKLISRKTSKSTKKVILSMLCATFIIFIGISTKDYIDNKKTNYITVGSKDFTEQHILANIIAELLRKNTDLEVRTAVNLGGTKICLDALNSSEIDIYVDYTGTIYGDILKQPLDGDLRNIYNLSVQMMQNKYDIIMLNKLGFNNTYTLAMRKEKAAMLGVKSISDLSGVSGSQTFASSYECFNRQDCYLGLQDVYGISFKNAMPIDSSPRYIALNEGQADVIDAFSTDGLLVKYDLLILKDDKNFFPPYDAVPLVRKEVVEKHPEILEVLKQLTIDDKTMSELNYKVDELGQTPEIVAKEFLLKKGLIEN